MNNVTKDIMSVTLKDFQDSAVKYLDKLPITLTRYGKPIAKVIGVQSVVEENVPVLEGNKKNFSDNISGDSFQTNPYYKILWFEGKKRLVCEHGYEKGECPICK